MFIEVIERHPLPHNLDRDDIEDLLTIAIGTNGEVTGAGVGSGRWHLDLDVTAEPTEVPHVVKKLAIALTNHGLGWVVLRLEHEATGREARALAT